MRTPVLVLAALILLSFTLSAQSPNDAESGAPSAEAGPDDSTLWEPRPTLQRGAWYVGASTRSRAFHGRANATTRDGLEGKFSVTGFGLSGMGGYFVANRIAIGPQVEFSYSRTVDNADNVNTVLEYSLGAHATYHLEIPRSPWVPVGRVVVGYERKVEKRDRNIEDQIENGYRIEPRIGANYFFTNRVAGGAELSYSYSRTKADEGDTTINVHAFGAGVGITLFFR